MVMGEVKGCRDQAAGDDYSRRVALSVIEKAIVDGHVGRRSVEPVRSLGIRSLGFAEVLCIQHGIGGMGGGFRRESRGRGIRLYSIDTARESVRYSIEFAREVDDIEAHALDLHLHANKASIVVVGKGE